MIETVQDALAAAARQGSSQARIQLAPPSLGMIRIQLRRTDDGMVARVVAEHSSTAQLLEQNGGELRRSLESAGVSVLHLDISASNELGERAKNPERSQSDGQQSAGAETKDDSTAPVRAAETTEPTSQSLVDVLA